MAAGRLILPTLPEVALAIDAIIGREDADVARVAREIAKDPATSARLLAAANSVAMRGAGKAADHLMMSITRLGLPLTRVLVNRIAMEQMFCARSASLNQIMKKTWTRSLETAALSRVLAQQYTKLNPETAMMAGLIHLVGVLPIIRLLDQHHQGGNESLHNEETIFKLQAGIGQLVLKLWKLPDELAQIPNIAGRFAYSHDNHAEYGDVLNVAIIELNHTNLHTNIDRSQIPAYQQLGIKADADVLKIQKVQDAYKQSLEMLTG